MVGLMRYKITLQQLALSTDGTGGTTAAWNTVKTLFADVQPMRANRLFVQGQEYVGVCYTLTCRYKSFAYTPPAENYRLLLDPDGLNKTLKILTLDNPDILSRYLVITAIEN